MKKIVWIVFFYFAHAYLTLAQPAELNGKLKFAWGDEFNGTAINTDIWKVTDNFDNYADGDGPVAIARNVSVSGGYLVCKAVKETYSCPTEYISEYWCSRQKKTGLPYNYTYGRVESKEKFNQQYGYVEANIHFDNQPGLWAAFWTFGGEGLPFLHNAGEVDIMETIVGSNSKRVTTNVHLNYCPEGTGTSCLADLGTTCPGVPCYGAEHFMAKEVWYSTKYALYWSPQELIFYINDVRVRTMPNPGVVDPLKFIMGMGVHSASVTSNSVFPSNFWVDYIHVYSLYECVNTTTVAIGQTVTDNTGKQNITASCTKIDGNGSTGGRMTLVAKNTIAILPSFGVKEGGYLEARISSNGRVNPNVEPMATNYYPIHPTANSRIEVLEKELVNEDVTVTPNPILNTAKINYSISKQALVKITIYNSTGIIQDVLVNENQLAGEHSYELDASDYQSGIYLLVFESGGTRKETKLVITK